jgi:hypothetical protein
MHVESTGLPAYFMDTSKRIFTWAGVYGIAAIAAKG